MKNNKLLMKKGTPNCCFLLQGNSDVCRWHTIQSICEICKISGCKSFLTCKLFLSEKSDGSVEQFRSIYTAAQTPDDTQV